jgi:hypothetical protein
MINNLLSRLCFRYHIVFNRKQAYVCLVFVTYSYSMCCFREQSCILQTYGTCGSLHGTLFIRKMLLIYQTHRSFHIERGFVVGMRRKLLFCKQEIIKHETRSVSKYYFCSPARKITNFALSRLDAVSSKLPYCLIPY